MLGIHPGQNVYHRVVLLLILFLAELDDEFLVVFRELALQDKCIHLTVLSGTLWNVLIQVLIFEGTILKWKHGWVLSEIQGPVIPLSQPVFKGVEKYVVLRVGLYCH